MARRVDDFPELSGSVWFLEGYDPASHRFWRVPVTTSPFRVGRRPGVEMLLVSPQVSLDHAELQTVGGGLALVDLASTNGTFVNGRLVHEVTLLVEGDIVRFAGSEFRVGRVTQADTPGLVHSPTTPISRPGPGLLEQVRRLHELLSTGAATALFQPIVRLRDRRVVGWEALGRGTLPDLPESPAELFEMAAPAAAEDRLAVLFRRRALELADPAEGEILFLNTHAVEMRDTRLLRELEAWRERRPELRLAVEISEHYGASVEALRRLRRDLAEIGVLVAYDDFGAGLARLNELAEAPPDYLKFDVSLIRGLDAGGSSKRSLVGALARTAEELGMETIAEGVESAAEAAICGELGFHHAQGFFFGRPGPALHAGSRR